MSYIATAPSNIALIKYMGKTNAELNLPTNASLSYTLDHLTSTVKLTATNSNDSWQPLDADKPIKLSAKAQQRFLNHLHKIKKQLNYQGHFIVQSSNNFPLGCGLASSASSFAALTKCAVNAIAEETQQPLIDINSQADLSRQGSGSSCRSFFKPWALWQGQQVKALDLPYPHLLHQVIVLSSTEKTISSSEAHQLVASSPAFEGRVARAESRLQSLIQALAALDWSSAYQICWDEFIDMHHLFQTASTPFDYMNNESRALLDKLQTFWQQHGSGPIVTMDAGPNIHLLYREQDAALKAEFEAQHLTGKHHVL